MSRVVEDSVSLVYLDQAANGDLIILQDDQRIVLNPEQVNSRD